MSDDTKPIPPLRSPVVYRLRARNRRFVYFDRLPSMMAEARTCHPGGGGSWCGLTGDGEAWRSNDRVWCWSRPIRRGQWAGPWRRQRIADIRAPVDYDTDLM